MKKITFLLTALLVSITSFAAALGSGYEKVTNISSLTTGDRVVVYADAISKGVTGWDGTKDATVAESGWVEYLVEVASGGVYLKDETANNYIASPGSSNQFKYGTKAVCSVNAKGVLACNSRYLYNNGTYYRMYGDKSSDNAYKPFYVYKVVAGGAETEDLGDALKWSAATATVQMGADDNEYPTLTNDKNVDVTYSSSSTTVATIDANGEVTLVKEGTTTISAKFAGGEVSGTTYAPKTVTYALTVLKAPATPTENVYVKVTSTAGLTDGEYLIVYEAGNVAFNGALATLDAVSNTVEVVINSNTIAGNTDIDAATFTINVTNGTILSASGKYIGKTANSNGLDVKTTAMTNTFAFDANGNAVITGSTAALRYNKAVDQKRFRYYKDGGGSQEKIALYKKASSHTLTYGTCTNGSVSADVADGATVLSGTTITLSNTPTADYKLSAYDVYKTDDATTKVTVADGKFIMPEFDVTISATFELAKTLTGIEITTPATQTTFWQGETFNHTGLEVTAHFNGAEDEDVTSKITVTGSTATAGTQTVTISYKEGATTETATYNITVKATANTQETAYNVATAREIIDAVSTAKDIYVTGVVSEIVTAYNSQYGNISYNISADGLTTSDQLLSYRGKSYNGENFTSDDDIQVGDEVVVKGNLKLYEDTYELDAGNQLVSLNRTKQQAGLSYTTTEYNVNLGDAFTAPTLNNPHTLAVTYSSNNEDVATVAADGAVTIKAAGTVTITASFAGNASYAPGEASYTIKVVGIASLPFAFDGKYADIANTAGMSQEGIDLDDYASSPHLKINTTGDYLTIHFDSEPDKLTYDIKGNSFSGGTFTVQESADGETYTTIATYTELGEKVSEEKELESTSRYVKFIYTKKVNGNVALGNISITKPDTRKDAGLAWSEETVTLTVGDAFTAPTLNNPNSVSDITYESSNEDVATVSDAGVIDLVDDAVGTATITASFAGDATYKPATATCTIEVKTVQEDCEGSDDFATDESENPLSYLERTTAAGWKATNAARVTIEDETYFAINGKTSAVGTITSPVLNGGLGSIKIRYANTYKEANGVSFQLDIKQNDEVVKTYTITKANAAVEKGTVYTELIENINVAGDFQMVFTNLHPTNNNKDNQDRVSIGRLCWTGYVAPTLVTPSVEKGIFSVADGKFVQFSTGNLQYEVGTNTWSFAENQYDYVGEANINVGNPNYEGKIDMFGWSADGKYGVNPSNDNKDYIGTFQDWGTLVNEEDWYTLSADEWKYLLNTRANASSLKQIAKVDTILGIMLFPDNWTLPADCEPVNTLNHDPEDGENTKYDFYTQNYTLEQWIKLEKAGAVFLPAAGRRTGGWGNTTISPHMVGVIGLDSAGHYKYHDNTNYYAYYWTSTYRESDSTATYLHNIKFLGNNEGTVGQATLANEQGRYGQSVRLVKAVEPDYTREVRQGYYGTICLRNGGQMIGASLFGLSYYNEAQGLLYMDEADATMVAGNPYIFLPNEGATNNTLYVFYDETTATKADTVNGLVGYLGDENMQLPGDGTNYILQDNKIKKVVGGNNSNVFVTKNRAYIQLGSVEPKEQAPVPGRRRVAIGQAPQVATGMESVDASAQPVKMIIDGQLYILRGEKMYDAQGKLVK